jgi:hypothetical protein
VFENALCRRTTKGRERFVYGGQQIDVGSRVALGEAAPMVDGLAGPAVIAIRASLNPRGLRDYRSRNIMLTTRKSRLEGLRFRPWEPDSVIIKSHLRLFLSRSLHIAM